MTDKQRKQIKKNKIKKDIDTVAYIAGVLIVVLCMFLISLESSTAIFIGTLIVLIAVLIIAYSNRQPSGYDVQKQFEEQNKYMRERQTHNKDNKQSKK